MRIRILVERIDLDPPWEEVVLDTTIFEELGRIVEYINDAFIAGNMLALTAIYQQTLAFEPTHADLPIWSPGRSREDDALEALRLQRDLAESIELLIRRKITTLLYEATRHGWDSDECRRRREEIAAVRPEFADYTRDHYVRWIEREETTHRTHFGEELSDDSDNDDDAPPTYRMRDGGIYPLGLDVRQQMARAITTPFVGTRMTMRDEEDWSRQATENATIHHPLDAWTEQVEADLLAVNQALAKGDRNVDRLTATRFCVAQYRGIAYNVVSFSAAARRANRELFELRSPVYCASVFEACGVSPGDFYAGRCPPETAGQLLHVAEQLKAILLAKRESGPITIHGQPFESHAYALQDFYTKDYDGFHRELREYFEHQRSMDATGPAIRPPEGGLPMPGPSRERWPLFEGLLNAKNPFVSTGNTPRHALRYAYGVKFYEGHGHERLRPRWRGDGRAERPYSGKVYVSLHPVSDYLYGGPLDVVSLNRQGKVSVVKLISAERESSFPAHIPGDRVVAEHIARYPSFSGEYQDYYVHKYGLTLDEYAMFRERIIKTQPHSATHRKNKRALGEWLVRYYEVRLIELARRIALQQGMVLVYRDEAGFLTRVLPTDVGPVGLSGVRSAGPGGQESSNTLGASLPWGLGRPLKQELPVQRRDALSFQMIQETYRRAARFRAWIRARFHVYPTLGDGNCLFHAIAAALEGAFTHVDLRETAVLQLGAEGNLPQQYLADMAQVAEHALQVERWGSDLEVGAIARALRINIRVYAPGDIGGYTLFRGNDEDTVAICLYHVGGNHWEWLQAATVQAYDDVFF